MGAARQYVVSQLVDEHIGALRRETAQLIAEEQFHTQTILVQLRHVKTQMALLCAAAAVMPEWTKEVIVRGGNDSAMAGAVARGGGGRERREESPPSPFPQQPPAEHPQTSAARDSDCGGAAPPRPFLRRRPIMAPEAEPSEGRPPLPSVAVDADTADAIPLGHQSAEYQRISPKLHPPSSAPLPTAAVGNGGGTGHPHHHPYFVDASMSLALTAATRLPRDDAVQIGSAAAHPPFGVIGDAVGDSATEEEPSTIHSEQEGDAQRPPPPRAPASCGPRLAPREEGPAWDGAGGRKEAAAALVAADVERSKRVESSTDWSSSSPLEAPLLTSSSHVLRAASAVVDVPRSAVECVVDEPCPLAPREKLLDNQRAEAVTSTVPSTLEEATRLVDIVFEGRSGEKAMQQPPATCLGSKSGAVVAAGRGMLGPPPVGGTADPYDASALVSEADEFIVSATIETKGGFLDAMQASGAVMCPPLWKDVESPRRRRRRRRDGGGHWDQPASPPSHRAAEGDPCWDGATIPGGVAGEGAQGRSTVEREEGEGDDIGHLRGTLEAFDEWRLVADEFCDQFQRVASDATLRFVSFQWLQQHVGHNRLELRAALAGLHELFFMSKVARREVVVAANNDNARLPPTTTTLFDHARRSGSKARYPAPLDREERMLPSSYRDGHHGTVGRTQHRRQGSDSGGGRMTHHGEPPESSPIAPAAVPLLNFENGGDNRLLRLPLSEATGRSSTQRLNPAPGVRALLAPRGIGGVWNKHVASVASGLNRDARDGPSRWTLTGANVATVTCHVSASGW